VLKKSGQTLARLDSINFPIPNAIDFALFPLLQGKTKQLVISQTVPRGGRHWMVDLSRGARVILYSGDYEVGREFIGAIDLD
jgi:hypothetical protein